MEENEEGPKQKYVRFLIVKSWRKRHKIEKFYTNLHKIIHKNQESTIITIKSLILLHNYFKKGPAEVLTDTYLISPESLLNSIHTIWGDIYTHKKSSQRDRKRNPYLSFLVKEYSSLLLSKLKLCRKYNSYFEGNYSLNPFFNSCLTKFVPLSPDLIDDLLAFLEEVISFQGKLLQHLVLWQIQLSLVLSIIDEEYCLISLITHLLFAFKQATNYISGKVNKKKLQKKVLELEARFERNYSLAQAFFLKCNSMKDLKNFKDLIPLLHKEVVNYIKAVPILQNLENEGFHVCKFLNYSRSIHDIKLPLSYGLAVQTIKLEGEKAPRGKKKRYLFFILFSLFQILGLFK